ncbi:MAG: peroxidase family protein [Pirellulaceae bacterium]|nr:peroxidase family protein [Pirellulaceae bacterium]
MKFARGCAAISQLDMIKKWCVRKRQAARDRSRRMFQRKLRTEFLESRQLMAADTLEHNVFDAEDVNDDGQCSPLDALLVIQALNARASSNSTASTQTTGAGNRVFPDVNNDGQRTPADALQVINRLNQRGANPVLDRAGNDASKTKPTIPSTTSQVRSYDGTGNNLSNTELGSTDERLLRIAPAEYEDGVSSPAGSDRANPRTISNLLSEQQEDSIESERDLSAFVYVWGQFIDHDVSLTTPPATAKESMSITIPAGDTFFDPDGSGDAALAFTRSRFDTSTGTSSDNPREQLNQITAWIDGSMVYGSSQETADSLRTFTGGQMRTSSGNLLPLSSSGMFLAGDIRANENIELTSLQTLWVREHNYWASKILAANPAATDEQVFQQARAIVIAEIQAITYNEWLPALLGRGALNRYMGYKPETNPSVANEFSTAAFRLGHSLLQDDIEFIGNDGLPVRDALELDEAFFNPAIVSAEGIDELLKYAASAQAAEIDTQVVDGVRNFLIDGPGGTLLDLAALNIQRGRDHGLADYNATRVAYGLAPVDSFDDITSNVQQQQALEAAYGDVDNIDLWIGGLAEDHVQGSSVGELVRTIVADQFQRLRDGDRFWYENIFSGRDQAILRNTRLSDVLQRNTSITNIQRDVFFMRSAFSGSVYMTPTTETVRRGGAGMLAGVAGVTVELLNNTGEVINTTVTDSRGQYRFGSVAETGDYRIRVIAKEGTKVVSADTLSVNVSRGDMRLHKLDFRLATA